MHRLGGRQLKGQLAVNPGTPRKWPVNGCMHVIFCEVFFQRFSDSGWLQHHSTEKINKMSQIFHLPSTFQVNVGWLPLFIFFLNAWRVRKLIFWSWEAIPVVWFRTGREVKAIRIHLVTVH